MPTPEPPQLPLSLAPSCVRAVLAGRKRQLRMAVAAPDGPCPAGEPGGLLWVREPYAEEPGTGAVRYQADDPGPGAAPAGGAAWRPAREMPRELSRLLLRIDAVRLERLQQIGEADMQAEGGIWRADAPPGESEREGFVRWWNGLQRKSGLTWEVDPWVWVVSFTPVAPPRPPG